MQLDTSSAKSVPARAAAPAQNDFRLTPPQAGRTSMAVTKRSGEREPVDVNKIVRAVSRCGEGLHDVDAMRVALKTIAGLYDGATTRELDELSIRTAASFIVEEPEYSQLAARLLSGFIDKEVQGQGYPNLTTDDLVKGDQPSHASGSAPRVRARLEHDRQVKAQLRLSPARAGTTTG